MKDYPKRVAVYLSVCPPFKAKPIFRHFPPSKEPKATPVRLIKVIWLWFEVGIMLGRDFNNFAAAVTLLLAQKDAARRIGDSRRRLSHSEQLSLYRDLWMRFHEGEDLSNEEMEELVNMAYDLGRSIKKDPDYERFLELRQQEREFTPVEAQELKSLECLFGR